MSYTVGQSLVDSALRLRSAIKELEPKKALAAEQFVSLAVVLGHVERALRELCRQGLDRRVA